MILWILIILVTLFIFLIIFLGLTLRSAHHIKEMAEKIERSSNIKDEINIFRREVSDRLSDVAKTTGSSTQIMANVQKGLGAVEEATKRVVDLSKGLSDLQQILSPPKVRGNLGEFFLEELLAQVIPGAYEMQHRFKTGNIVDAVIKIGDLSVPVDAKFPLENFKKVVESRTEEEKKINRKKFISDVKGHIDDISAKYILPDEGTFNFALMYIPAENVYYETIVIDESSQDDKGIFSYSIKNKVIAVSPNSFYAYLQVIALGLKGMNLEKSAQQILINLARLEGNLKRFREDFEILGKHLRDARGKYDDGEKKLIRLEDKFGSLEKPEHEEMNQAINS
jgi:DNA recombination protein RmuC